MNGSVWVKLRVWQVGKRVAVISGSAENVYGYSASTELNTRYQRQYAYKKAVNKALAEYRDSHGLDSDTEVNYHKINDGIQVTGKNEKYVVTKGRHKGKVIRGVSYHRTRISNQEKREAHKVAIGKSFLITPEERQRMYAEDDVKVDVKPVMFKSKTRTKYDSNSSVTKRHRNVR